MKTGLIITVLALFFLSACTGANIKAGIDAATDNAMMAENGSDTAGNAQVEIRTNGSTTNVKINSDTKEDTGVVPPMSEWCKQGQTFDYSEQGSRANAVIIGPATFKGQEYCKGEETVTTNEMTVKTVYHFTYEAKDMWIQSTINGQTSEVHVTS